MSQMKRNIQWIASDTFLKNGVTLPSFRHFFGVGKMTLCPAKVTPKNGETSFFLLPDVYKIKGLEAAMTKMTKMTPIPKHTPPLQRAQIGKRP